MAIQVIDDGSEKQKQIAKASFAVTSVDVMSRTRKSAIQMMCHTIPALPTNLEGGLNSK
jgi:hypothetical protein